MGKNKNPKQFAGKAAPYHQPVTSSTPFCGNYQGHAPNLPAPQPLPPPSTEITLPPPPTAGGRAAPANRRGRPSLRVEAPKQRANSTNAQQDLVRLIARYSKGTGYMTPTANNGFNRGLKPDAIVASLISEEEGPLFFVRFKSRKTPELIALHEVRHAASELLVDFYCSILQNGK